MQKMPMQYAFAPTLLVIAPSGAAGRAYLSRIPEHAAHSGALVLTPRGLRDALLGIPDGAWRSMGAWEQRRLWGRCTRDAMASQRTEKDGDAPTTSNIELDVPTLQWLRRAGVAPSTLLQAGPSWRLASESLGRFAALCEEHCLLDDVALERIAQARLRSGRVPAAWRHLREARVLASAEVHGELLRWVEALAAAKIGSGIEVLVDVAFNAQTPERTPYAQLQLAFMEKFPDALDGIEHVATVHKTPPEMTLVSVAWGEAVIDWTVQKLCRHLDAGLSPGALSVVFPRSLVRGARGKQGLQLVQRLKHALLRLGIQSHLELERGMAQASFARRLQLGLEQARALDVQRPLRPNVLGDLVLALADDLERGDPKKLSERETLARCLYSLVPRTWLIGDIEAVWQREGGEAAQMVPVFMAWRQRYLEPLAKARSLGELARIALVWANDLGAEREECVRLEDALAELLIAESQAQSWGAQPLGVKGCDEALQFVLEGVDCVAVESAQAITLGTAEGLLGRTFDASIWWGANPSLMRSQLAGSGRLPESVVDVLEKLAPSALGGELRPRSSELRARWLFGLWQTDTRGARAVVSLDYGDADDLQPSHELLEDIRQYLPEVKKVLPAGLPLVDGRAPHIQRRQIAARGRALADNAWRALLPDERHAPYVRRVLFARALKTQPSWLDGAAKDALAQRIASTVHSVTALDALAQCRYRFFADRSLRLVRPEQLSPELLAKTRGSVAHQALFEVYSALTKEQPFAVWRTNPVRCRERGQQLVREHYEDIVRGKKVSPRMNAPLREDVERIVDVQLQRDLLAAEGEPIAFELAFGSGKDGTQTLKVVHPDNPKRLIEVRGSIDRIDRLGSELTVIDYKSSLPAHTVEDRHLQLALYELVAATAFADVSALGAKWVKLGGGVAGAQAQKVPKNLSGDVQSVVDKTRAVLFERLDPLLLGNIAPDAPNIDLCKNCSYSALCRFVPESSEEEVDASGEAS